MRRSIIVLCFLLNWFGESAMGGDSALVYPQFVIGGGFETALVIANSTSEPWDGRIVLPGFSDGRVWLVNGEEQTGNDRLEVSLPANGARRLLFAAPAGAEAVAGSLEILASDGSSTADLATAFFYNFFLDGQLVDSVGTAASVAAHHITIPVERAPGERVNTGVAIRTLSSGYAPAGENAEPVFKMSLYDDAGVLMEVRFGSFLGARFFDQIFPAAIFPEGRFTGSLIIESEIPLYATALRQQLLDGGRFQLTGVPPLAPADDAPAASFTARYSVSFDSTWSFATHPTDFPPGPHFSGLIGGVHNSAVRFWEPGSTASPGIEQMAELGRKTPLDSEVGQAVAVGNALAILSGGGIFPSPGQVELEFEVNQKFPLVTLVSMIAPSPDWFVGVRDLNLFVNGGWTDQVVVELFPYDAGTDSGVTYTSADQDTVPRQPIRRIEGDPFVNQGAVAPMGTFTFRRIQ